MIKLQQKKVAGRMQQVGHEICFEADKQQLRQTNNNFIVLFLLALLPHTP